jgi:hypothetical protein
MTRWGLFLLVAYIGLGLRFPQAAASKRATTLAIGVTVLVIAGVMIKTVR